jgi:hypothetical protein
LLRAFVGLDDVHPTATLTEAALLSGTPRKERDENSKGGLLRVIGDFGIILCKDFGSVLSMNRDTRGQVLAGLREVYDGSWTRHVGTDGGRTLDWSGKVGLIAGCTPAIDRHHAVMAAMGERFTLLRLPEVDEDEQARRALAHAGGEAAMRAELVEAVGALFAAGLREPRPLENEDRHRLVSLSTLAVRARSAIERDGYSREIELIPEPEAPTRLIIVLSQLLSGLDAIGADRAEAWAVVTRCALDSIPAIRRSVLSLLHGLDGGDELETAAAAERLGYPTATTRRALEELTAHRLVHRRKQGAGQSDYWRMRDWTREKCRAVGFPEMSVGERNGTVPETSEVLLTLPLHVGGDKSGKVPSFARPGRNGRAHAHARGGRRCLSTRSLLLNGSSTSSSAAAGRSRATHLSRCRCRSSTSRRSRATSV